MNSETLLARLPLLPESRLDMATAPAAPWWQTPKNLLPIVARPQLSQELSELVKFARLERITLVPYGSASFRFIGELDSTANAILLVQPGCAAVWAGPDQADQAAWLPAGYSLEKAELALNEHGLTLSLWPQDCGTIGGNWVMPRGSFASREFLFPATRRLGVEVLLAHGEWLSTKAVPRSAAGPNIARFLCGTGGTCGLVTKVRLATQRQGERVFGSAKNLGLLTTLKTLRSLILEEYVPTACTLRRTQGGVDLWWQQNLNSGWAERTWKTASERLKLTTAEADATPPYPFPGIPEKVNWKTLLSGAETADGSNLPEYLAGPTPEGMSFFSKNPAMPAAHWQDWLAQTTHAQKNRA